MKKINIKFFVYLQIIFFLSITPSYSYIGLAPLIPILGQLILFIFIAVLSFLGIFFYPIRLYLKKRKEKKKQNKSE